jgi:hypothetical protein
LPIDVSYVTAVIEVPVFALVVGVDVEGLATDVPAAFESGLALSPPALLHAVTRNANVSAPTRRASIKAFNTDTYPRPPGSF